MSEHQDELAPFAARGPELYQQLQEEGAEWFFGAPSCLRLLLATRLMGGHALLSGPPGVGKTTLASRFGKWSGRDVKRIQMSPDMMPMDVTGAYALDRKSGEVVLRKGPVFSGCLVADELNRAPGRVHATLLEAMEEGQVSIEGETHALPDGLFVLATRNPGEISGAFQLPRALIDRFTMELRIDYPDAVNERRLYGNSHAPHASPGAFFNDELAEFRRAVDQVFIAPELISYVTACIRSLRASQQVLEGPSPRVGLSWISVARSLSLLDGRTFVTAQDLHDSAVVTICHRIHGTPPGESGRARIYELVTKTISDQPYLTGPSE